MLFGGHRPTCVLVESDVLIKTGEGKLCGLLVVGGSAVTNIILYDNTVASGTVVFDGSAPINSISPLVSFADFQGKDFETGLYADITTTGGRVYAWYI